MSKLKIDFLNTMSWQLKALMFFVLVALFSFVNPGGLITLACSDPAPSSITNDSCPSWCGSRCGRVWVNNAGVANSSTVSINSSSGTTTVSAYGVVNTCTKTISNWSNSTRISSTDSDPILLGTVASIARAPVSSKPAFGCPNGAYSGFSIDNAKAYSKCSGASCNITINYISYWEQSSNPGYHSSTVSVVIPPPPVGVLRVNGGTTASYTRLLPGDKITFRHTGSATCTGGDCTKSILFYTQSSPSNAVGSITYSGDQGSKLMNPNYNDEVYTITSADLGGKVCRNISWSVDGGERKNGESECVNIPKPTLKVSSNSSNNRFKDSGIYPGEIVTFTHTASATCVNGCNNTLSFTSGNGPSNSITGGPDSSKETISFTYSDGTGTVPKKMTNITETYTAKEEDIGKKICRNLSWSNSTNAIPTATVAANHSNPSAESCVTILKPYVDLTPDTSTTKTGATTEVDKAAIKPAEKATFTHKFNLVGKGNYLGSITAEFNPVSGPSNTRTISDSSSGKSLTISYGTLTLSGGKVPIVTRSDSDDITESHTATQDDVGHKICRRIQYGLNPIPNSNQVEILGTSSGHSTEACVLVPYQYKLTPSVVVNNENANTPVVPGAVIPITGSVNNAGPTKSKDTRWVLSRFILEPSQTLENPGITGRNYTVDSQLITSLSPSQFFNHRGYESQQSDSRVFDFGDISNFVTDTFTIPSTAKIGEKYCFSLSVQPHSSNYPAGTNDDHWRHARPICVIVSKHPLTQIHGAGLILPQGATKGYLTINPSDGSQYGSWMEYDILSGNLTTPADEFVASNAGHLINFGTASKDKWHQLTFANTPIYGKFGTNLPANRAQSLFSYYSGIAKTSANTIAKPAGDVILHNLSYPGTIHYMSNTGGTLTLSGQLPNYKSLIVIQDGGNVVINGNITYQNQGGFSKASDFSQLIIIVRNGNIIINENVTQVDAWLVATGNNPNRGRLKTCNKTDDKVSMHDCVELLTVNGPVIVDYVDLLRTRGNDVANNTLGQPAEVFNFRPDSYLWAIGRSPELPVFETIHTKDLPPRY